MKTAVILFFIFLGFFSTTAQTATFNSAGNWDLASNWAGSNIGDAITETVVLNSNATVRNTFSYTTGAVTLSNNVTLTVNTGGTLTLGASGNAKSMTTNNNANLTINGTLVIWGDLIVNNNIVLNITGTMVVHGSVQLNNNGNVNITNGKLQVTGNFNGGNNNNVTTSGTGTVDVSGNVNIGNGSNLNGPTGSFHLSGTCTGPTSFCSKSTLPIVLSAFKTSSSDNGVLLEWTTVSELNFDYFNIEKSTDGVSFSTIGKIQGHGTTRISQNYQFEDTNPMIGKNYYRLVSVDFDEYTETFPVIMIKYQGAKNFSISPNPGNGQSLKGTLNFESVQNSQVIIIYNSVGTVISSFEVHGIEAVVNFSTPLLSGTYYAKYVSEDFTKVVRFIVY